MMAAIAAMAASVSAPRDEQRRSLMAQLNEIIQLAEDGEFGEMESRMAQYKTQLAEFLEGVPA